MRMQGTHPGTPPLLHGAQQHTWTPCPNTERCLHRLKCNGTGVSQDATSSTLPSLPSFPSSTSPLKTPAGDASTLFKLPSSSTPGSTASGTGGLPFSLPSASSQQNPAGSLLGQFSDPFSFGTKSIEDDAAAPSGPADDPEDDEAHHPYEENETHG